MSEHAVDPVSKESVERGAAFADPDLQRPKRKALQEHPLCDEILLYASDQAEAFSLNASAKAVWDLCDGRHTIADICRELGGRFECSEAQLTADVHRAVCRLRELDLLEAEGALRPKAAEGERRP
jgi:hypothetical protein